MKTFLVEIGIRDEEKVLFEAQEANPEVETIEEAIEVELGWLEDSGLCSYGLVEKTNPPEGGRSESYSNFFQIPVEPGITARGRNGYFEAKRIDVSKFGDRGRVEVFSKQIGKTAPVSFASENIEDLRKAFLEAFRKLEELTGRPEKTFPEFGSLIKAARLVVSRWEKGDLATAVYELGLALDHLENEI